MHVCSYVCLYICMNVNIYVYIFHVCMPCMYVMYVCIQPTHTSSPHLPGCIVVMNCSRIPQFIKIDFALGGQIYFINGKRLDSFTNVGPCAWSSYPWLMRTKSDFEATASISSGPLMYFLFPILDDIFLMN